MVGRRELGQGRGALRGGQVAPKLAGLRWVGASVPLMPARRVVPLFATLVALLAAVPAHANGVQLSVMMDDDNLIYRSPTTSDKTLDTMAQLGVDTVRVTVLWKVVADHARSTKARDRRFRRLGADNPKAYPSGNWDRYDHVVRSAGARGMGVYFDITGPGPSWCCAKPPKSERENAATWKPSARQFKLFVRAVGKRYSGKYRDENFRGKDKRLPRVTMWALWNEPNQGGWLTPQWVHGKPYSPQLYRSLYFAGHQGLVGTGHANDTILIGETAPNGKTDRSRSRSPMYPTTFIKTLFCTDGNGNQQSGPGCDQFVQNGPFEATAWAHHPYTKDRSPTTRDPSRAAITMANLDTLTGLLDKIAKKTDRIQSDIPIALTEFGYETQPPDPYHGVSLAKQADYSNTADLIAWANPRVISQTQFLLRDVAPVKSEPKTSKRYWFTYQSGLFFHNGQPKPSAAAYAFPFIAQPVSRNADGKIVYVFWGQARFRPNRAQDNIYLQYKATGTKKWVNFGGAIPTQLRNYFYASVPSPGPGEVRAAWLGGQAPYAATTRPVATQ